MSDIPDTTRELINWWHECGIPSCQIAELAQCDVRTVNRIVERYRETGNPHALPHGHAPYIITDDDTLFLIGCLRANPTLFLDELQERLWTQRNIWASLASLSRALERHGWSHKKLSKEAAQRNARLRAAWKVKYGVLPMHCFVWLDESGVEDRDHHRKNGWAPVGMTPVTSRYFGAGDGRVTMLPALTSEGIIAMDILDGGVTTERFIRFLQNHLVRTSPGHPHSCSNGEHRPHS
jgi:transposase